MNINESYYVREVMNNKDSAEFWQSANESLAQCVYEQVKQETPVAKLYIFSGVQVITTNQAQKETLLRFLEMEEDICSAKINEIQEIKRQIEPVFKTTETGEQIAMVIGLATVLFIFCLFCENQVEKWQEKRRRARNMEQRIAQLRGGRTSEGRESTGNIADAGADTDATA